MEGGGGGKGGGAILKRRDERWRYVCVCGGGGGVETSRPYCRVGEGGDRDAEQRMMGYRRVERGDK